MGGKPLRVLIVTPAPPKSRLGNRITALRWSRLLREAGHEVVIAQRFDRQRCDALIALHARRSHDSVARFRRLRPHSPLILALTGTDLYGDIHRDESARLSLDWAHRYILLQEAGVEELPSRLQDRARVIVQSVQPPRGLPLPSRRGRFEVCVVGHLREVKDPFRAAEAARRLPEGSRVRILHVGGAMTRQMEERARDEERVNPRYEWLGELSHGRTLRLIARSRLMVLSSRMEGGANVVCEALAYGTPVISSHISGSIGLLGADYPGYFPFGDTPALTRLLSRSEESIEFLDSLCQAGRSRAHLVDPAQERTSLVNLLAEFD